MAFYPLAFTTFGLPSRRTLSLLNKCAAQTGNADGFMRHMLSAVSVAIQRGNAQIINAAMARWWEFGVR